MVERDSSPNIWDTYNGTLIFGTSVTSIDIRKVHWPNDEDFISLQFSVIIFSWKSTFNEVNDLARRA